MNGPRTLFGRLVLILFGSLVLAQALTFALVLIERRLVMREMMASYLVVDLASSVAMLDRLPAPEREGWLPRLQRANYHLSLGGVMPAEAAHPTDLAASLSGALSQALSQPVLAMDAHDADIEFRLGLRLKDGTPLTVALAQPRLRLSPWLLATLAAQCLLLAGGCWFAVRQATRPLARLAEAARAMEPGRLKAPLAQEGPREVGEAVQAFNLMRLRIDAHLEERSQMLGAISHDLQTPITRMRLRADLLQDGPLRDKLHADLGQMQHLVEQGLAYARTSHAVQEPEVQTDLLALLQSSVADAQDAGQPVQWLGGSPAAVKTRPKALQRVIHNLIDNAIKFAGAAQVQLVMQDGHPAILVLDRGPGIPPEEQDKVLQPFYRIEGSRNLITGGTGLGLAIVQRLMPHCHAELSLQAREGGGLQAGVRLLG